MRELTKSMFSYSWAMSLFWAKQMVNMTVPTGGNQWERAAGNFEPVTRATVDQFGSTLKAAFNAGDNVQRGFVDLAFGMFNPGNWDPNRFMRMSADAAQQTARAAQEAGQAAASGMRQQQS